jgi:hypothetical protein
MKRSQQKQHATMLKQPATIVGFLGQTTNYLHPCECNVSIICIVFTICCRILQLKVNSHRFIACAIKIKEDDACTFTSLGYEYGSNKFQQLNINLYNHKHYVN